jgi:two-component system sensor histidine kinase PhoQ
LQRGARADTVTSGQGIGLAVAVEIVSAYGGEMKVGRSILGGASFSVSFVQKLQL